MNPFQKYLTKEDHLHRVILNYLRYQYPGCRPAHAPNEGRRSKFEQFKLKWLGVATGLPDIMVYQARGIYRGLALEVKVKPNKPTTNQLEWIEFLRKNGWRAEVVYSIEEVVEITREYFGPRPMIPSPDFIGTGGGPGRKVENSLIS